jgi:hypothetical protein
LTPISCPTTSGARVVSIWDYFISLETIPWHGDFFMVIFCHFEKNSLEKNILSKIPWFEKEFIKGRC